MRRTKNNILFMLVLVGFCLLTSIFMFNQVQAVPNAAMAYCLRLNELYGNESYGFYNYTIQHTPTGDKDFCIMPNGTALDAWAFFAGDVGANYSICTKEGYAIDTFDGGIYASRQAVCTVCNPGLSCEQVPAGEVAEINMSDNPYGIGECKGACSMPVSLGTNYEPINYPEWNWKDPPSTTIWKKENYTGFNTAFGWMTPIKVQGTCLSCWTFGTAATVEARYKLEQHEPKINPDLSEQYLLSCSNAGDCETGGDRFDAMTYMKDSGITDESCFPYVNSRVSCSSNSKCSDYDKRRWKISSDTFQIGLSTAGIEDFIINYGPVTIIMDWGGEFDNSCVYRCDNPPPEAGKHITVLVGYKDTGNPSTSYWIAKNSFGENWPGGDCEEAEGPGYFRLAFDTSSNNCSIGPILFPEQVIAPDYGPFIKSNLPQDNDNIDAQPIKFNFTAYPRVAQKANCELIVNDTVKNITDNAKGKFVFNLTLAPGLYNWKVKCWETGVGIINVSETRALTVSLPDNVPPTYSQAYNESAVAGQTTTFGVIWADNSALKNNGQYIFSFDNCNNGNFVNDSKVNFTGQTEEELTILKVISPTIGCKVQWRFFAKDNAGNWAATPTYSFLTVSSDDKTPPTYGLGSSNNTVAGNITNFQVNWEDGVALKTKGQYTFSFDNCTNSFVNDSPVNFTAQNSQTVNLQKVISSTVGCKIQWRVYAKDNASNWALTPTYSFFTSERQEALSLASFSQKIGPNSSLISFAYNLGINATIKYGKSKRYLFNKTNSTFFTKHSFMLTNLESNTTYYYDLIVCDQKNVCEETVSSFRSLIAGSNMSNFTEDEELNESDFNVTPGQNCTENQKKCSADNKLLWTCKNNAWESETCKEACKNGRCYSESAGFKFEFGEIDLSSFIVPLILVVVVSILIVIVVIILIRKKN